MIYRPIKSDPLDDRLGRFIPDDFEHVEKYPARAVMPESVRIVNKFLKLPSWHWSHDQGQEGSCVGHGIAMERATTNTNQNILAKLIGLKTRRYDPIDVWNEAKKIDQWDDTNPGDDNGTSVRAGYDVARNLGLRRVKDVVLDGLVPRPIGHWERQLSEGVAANRWATKVDEMRTSISKGIPVTIGVNWYENFSTPLFYKGEYWIGRGRLGQITGGHCVCISGASDKRQAFRIKNSWGRNYPLVWLPYATMQRLLDEDGEAALVTDR